MADGGWNRAVRQVGGLLGLRPASDQADGAILARFVAGQGGEADRAFGALVDRHGAMVRRVCRQVLRHDHDADDAYQAVFLVLARRARSIRDPDRLAGWLHGVAVRTAHAARRRRPDREGIDAASLRDPAVVPADQAADRSEAAALLHAEIVRLPAAQRAAVVLCHLEGLTHGEAASRLGVPSGTVGVRLMRARDRLRERLARRGLDPAMGLLGLAPRSGLAPPAAIAVRFLRGGVVGEVPAAVASLAQGVIYAMFWTHARIAATVVGVGLMAATATAWSVAPSEPRPARPPIPVASPTPRPAEDPALAEFNRVYRLDPGQVVKRIAPPYLAGRQADIEARYPFLKENRERRGVLTTIVYRERDGRLEDPMMTFAGSADDPGRWLIYLLDGVAGLPAQDVVGADGLLKTPVQGDWIVRAGATPEQVVPALEAILRRDIDPAIRLTLSTPDREVVVVRGRYRFQPLTLDRNQIELYGATLTPGVGGGGTGGFAEFLKWTGEFVEPHRHLVDEAEVRPVGQISWHLNYRDRMTDQTTREDRGDEAVFRHLTEQTGLTFARERRQVRVVTVERADPAPAPSRDLNGRGPAS